MMFSCTAEPRWVG